MTRISLCLFLLGCGAGATQPPETPANPDAGGTTDSSLPVPDATPQSLPTCAWATDPGDRVLLFVPANHTYWSEYIVMRRALEAAGYQVDVRSSHAGLAHAYQVEASLSATEGYAAMVAGFADHFGASWSTADDTIGTDIAVGDLGEITSMDEHAALVIVGGKGALAYRYDDADGYAALPHPTDPQRTAPASEIAAAAERLNRLGLEAQAQGKPILAQCHGGTLPAFFVGDGRLLAGRSATAYPLGDGDTAAAFAAVGASFRPADTVVVDSPAFASVGGCTHGRGRVITTRDWLPSTVAQGARTLLDVLETRRPERQATVLLLHGGPVDVASCGAGNRANDVPCNYGVTPTSVIPADHTDVAALLAADSPNDELGFTVTQVNLTGTLPFDATDAGSVGAYLDDFDVVVHFKHWNTGFTAALQTALVAYAEGGGGVVGLHHALYNDLAAGGDKSLVARTLFGAEATSWAPNLSSYQLVQTNPGHFITSHGVSWPPPSVALASPPAGITRAASHAALPITDEIYDYLAYYGTPSFGRGAGQITPLLANTRSDLPGQVYTSGFARRLGAGRAVYLQAGERKNNFAVAGPYGQMVRNAVAWAAR